MNLKIKVNRSDINRAIEAEKKMEIIRIVLDGKEFYTKTKFSRNKEVEIWIWRTEWGYSEDLIKDGFYSICCINKHPWLWWIKEFNDMSDNASRWKEEYIIEIDETK